uniref:Uncharacterized protein n=1 Tax=Acrobeloides nanus TaxID=290746 RepID=A0A914DEN5_9BILA
MKVLFFAGLILVLSICQAQVTPGRLEAIPSDGNFITQPPPTSSLDGTMCVFDQWCRVEERCCPANTGRFRCCPAQSQCSADGLSCFVVVTNNGTTSF